MKNLDRTTFRTSRLLDFCSEKELIAQTGHRPEDWPLVVLKELVDNSLDACEEAGVPPVITVTVDTKGITVADNGPGIPADVIKDVLDFTIRVSSREAYVAPDRGAQGNALKTIVALPFVLDGERGHVTIQGTGGRHEITFAVDPIRQEPVITHAVEDNIKTGSSVTVHWPDSACTILSTAKGRFLQIADDFTWLNPHLALTVDWYGETTTTGVLDPDWRKWKPSDPTSPHWYSPANLERLIAGYIAHDEDHDRRRTVREFVSEFRGLTGSAKQKVVLETTGLGRAALAVFRNGSGLDGERIGTLLDAMRAVSKPVKPAQIGVIGKANLRNRFETAGCEMESFDYRKVTGETDGVPWVIETAFGWCPGREDEEAPRRIVTGVNWSPGIINPFRQLGPYGESLDTVLSQQRATSGEPVVLILHMACPRVEYTDRGKSAVVVN